MAELTPVQEFYKDKTIFITGASGFMGKVLIEKLLYACSAVKEVIILMRPKKGKVPETRLEEMFRLPIFQRIKEEKPHVLKKLTIVQGDVTFDSLGLSGETLNHVIENTGIIYHMAATLRLEGSLKDAIQMNTSGTKRVIDIAKKMSKLVAFIHLSTAFCNCEQEVMYEKVYDFPHDPEDLIRCAEWMDTKTLETITPELLKPHPNTYTYSKRLAEILVRDQYPNLPMVITRPSIVSPSAFEPVSGWVDNLNGPTGLALGAAKGVIRSMLCNLSHKSEVIPVDYAINGLIVIAYETATSKEKPTDIPVFNITIPEHRKLTWKEALDLSKKIGYQYPPEIVSPAAFEPLPGWVDNLNGPTGLMIGAGKGVIRSMLCDGRYKSEVIPVDFAINGLITIAFETATAKIKPDKIPVFNITCSENKKITWEKVMNLGKRIGYEFPFEAGLWYPDGGITTSKFYHLINVVLFHWLPAYVVDFLLLCAGQKRFMVRVQNRISTGLEVLQFFTTRAWDFRSENYEKLYTNLTEKEKLIFNMNMNEIEDEEYLKIGILGGRQYILKEPLTTLPKARKQLKALYILDRTVKAIILGFLIYWILSKTGLLCVILDKMGF